MLHGTKDVAMMLTLTLASGETNQYPQIKIYDNVDALETTVNLSHVADGTYKGTWTPTANGRYNANMIVYTDAGHSIESTKYGRRGAHIEIDERTTQISFIHNIEGGRWLRDGTKMYFYEDDNVTLVATFDLLDVEGGVCHEGEDPYERRRA